VITRRGNLNLVIGVITTSIAVTLLAYMVVGAQLQRFDWPSVLSHYLPRITTVIFVEVFAFFFLRLYRNGLLEVKYYQNELTNLTMHALAIETAVANAGPADQTNVISALIAADRNSIRSTSREPGTSQQDVAEILRTVAAALVEAGKKAK
jgi:hypothetical protein